MKFILAVFLVLGLTLGESNFGDTGFVGTSKLPASTDGTLYEQPYDFPNLTNGIYVYAPQFACADNFAFTSSATIKSIAIWMVFTTAGHPYDITLDIYQDNSGEFGTCVWSDTIAAANQTETLTGDQQWGFDLYRSDLQLQNYPTLPAGTYWLAVSVLSSSNLVAWLVCDPTYPPNMKQYNSGTWNSFPYDCWFGLYDHDVALARTTWASIKTAF